MTQHNNPLNVCLLSPILQTIHPGIGSALIHNPLSDFSTTKSLILGSFAIIDLDCGKKTCKAWGVGSAYRSLMNGYFRDIERSKDDYTDVRQP